jgi:hypothetical protein
MKLNIQNSIFLNITYSSLLGGYPFAITVLSLSLLLSVNSFESKPFADDPIGSCNVAVSINTRSFISFSLEINKLKMNSNIRRGYPSFVCSVSAFKLSWDIDPE